MKSRRSMSGGKMERKDVEKNRRLHMKSLCLKLSSLIPSTTTTTKQDGVTQLDHLDHAAAYIRQLKGRIHQLKQRTEAPGRGNGSTAEEEEGGGGAGAGVSMPVVEVRQQEATLDVVLISRVGEAFKLHQVIGVLEQEGAEVVNATFSVVGDKIFYTIHSQAHPLAALHPHRLSQRLRELLLQ